MTTFDTQWWIEHGATYIDEFKRSSAFVAQEAAILDALAPLKFESVIEVGAGFGRITRLVYDTFRPAPYIATDVSLSALANLSRYCEGRDIERAVINLDEIAVAPLTDLVVASEVLMHRPDIKADVAFLAATARKYVVNVDWYEPGAGEAAGCYQHDYDALFAPFGKVTRIEVPAARQAIWLTKVEVQ